MLVKPETCEGCSLYASGKGYCPDKIAPHARYVFWAEAPGRNEIIQHEPFVGKAGYVLKNWLMHAVLLFKVAFERGEITFANTLRCLPPEIQGRAYPRGEDRRLAEQHCRQYDPSLDGVETIVLFGEAPQRVWFDEELRLEDATDKRLGHDLKGVSGRIGREYLKGGKRWILAPHPAYILRQPALVAHGQAALKIAANQERVVDVEYVPWEAGMEALA